MEYKKDLQQIKGFIDELNKITKIQDMLQKEKLELTQIQKCHDHLTFVNNRLVPIIKQNDIIFQKYKKKSLLNISKQKYNILIMLDQLLLCKNSYFKICERDVDIMRHLTKMIEKKRKHDQCREC
jgi:hypothetical protein